MQHRIKNIVLYSVVSISLILAIVALIRLRLVRQELSQVLADLAKRSEITADKILLNEADSLLAAGAYKEVVNLLSDLADSSDASSNLPWTWRLAVAEQILRHDSQEQYLIDSLVNLRTAMDTLLLTAKPSAFEGRAYDSLLYALQKAKVKVGYLAGQLKKRDEGAYLSLKTHQGNTMHYVGEVKNGKANGKGIALLSTGSRYEGQWQNNMRHGQGTFYWPDGEYYIGEFKNDRRSGEGTYHWPDGQKFVGQWDNNQRNGEGIFYGVDGEVVASGTWQNDELVEVDKN